MNAAVTEPARWTRHRWFVMVFVVTALQVIVAVMLSDSSLASLRRVPRAPVISLIAGTPVDEQLAGMMTDPTLFALANRRGFSGPVWLKTPVMEHRLAEWTEPARWLPQTVTNLGSAFMRFTQTNSAAPSLVADFPAPQLATITVAPLTLPTRSTLRIEGDLEARPLVSPLEIPSLPSTDFLTNSVVQVIVNSAGYTSSARLLSVSGAKSPEQRAADQRALELAKAARFRPLPANDPAVITMGNLIFHWATQLPPATNTPPIKPSL